MAFRRPGHPQRPHGRRQPPHQALTAADPLASEVTPSITVWMNRILSRTATGSTNGYRSSWPIERFTMFSDHDSGSHISMIFGKALGPNAGRSKVADAGARPHH